jgi:hypothetical protein
MSIDNPLWGAPRIHGELLKLGFEVAQSSVAKYMVKRRGPPSQGWRTFLRSHAPNIAAMDLFVVPTIGFDLLYAFVIVRIDRRDLVRTSRATDHAMAFRVCGASISALAAPWGEFLTQHPLDSSADICCLQFAHGLSVMRCAEVQETIAPAC